MASKTDLLVATESFIGRLGNAERIIRQGELISPDDPAVKKWPDKFSRAPHTHEPPVEQATAAPGEKRGK